MADSTEASRRVLIVEDHPPTSRLLVEALEQAGPAISCVEARSGETALERLTREDTPGADPDLVLLDLDLPGITGFEVLEALDAQPELRRTPVVVVSGDTSRETIERCYELNARTFIPKPDDWNQFTALAESIASYWFDTADRPTRHAVANAAADGGIGPE